MLVLSEKLIIRACSYVCHIFSMYLVRAGERCMLALAFMSTGTRLYADVATEGDALVLRVPSAHLVRLLMHSPGFRAYMMNSMSGYVVKMLSLVEEVTFERQIGRASV